MDEHKLDELFRVLARMSSIKDLMNGYAMRAQQDESMNSSRKRSRPNHHPAAADDTTQHPQLDENDAAPEKYDGPPHFLIVGAQKAGTMAAVKNLNKHPQVSCLSEVHYFDLGWHSKTKTAYRDLFRGPKTMLGEKTPELIYVDECLVRMRSVLSPTTKFIFFVRDPIKRAYSAWNMNRSKDRESSPFDDCIDANLRNLGEYRSYGTAEYHLVQRGFYMDQIERFLKVFPDRSRLLVVVAEHVKTDPQTHYNRMFDFLGVDVSPSEGMCYEDDHVGQYSAPMGKGVKDKLKKVYQSHNERLFGWLGYRIPEWEGGQDGSSSVICIDDGNGSASASASATVDSSSTVDASGSGSGGGSSSSQDGLKNTSAPPSAPSSSSSSSVHSSSHIALDPWLARTHVVSGQPELLYPPTALTTGPFAVAGLNSGTDKITHHGYQRFYPR